GPRLLALEHLTEQLLDTPARGRERAPAERGRAVHAPRAPAVALVPGSEVTLPLHRVQDRVQRPGAEPVSMASELVDHPLPEHGAGRSVVQDVEPDEAAVQAPIVLVSTAAAPARRTMGRRISPA